MTGAVEKRGHSNTRIPAFVYYLIKYKAFYMGLRA
jgi:hypothetical protein